jgi:hypothetical protein
LLKEIIANGIKTNQNHEEIEINNKNKTIAGC